MVGEISPLRSKPFFRIAGVAKRRRNVVQRACFRQLTRKANSLSAQGGTDCPPKNRPPNATFSTASPKIIVILVTNDLYRKYRKAQARSMHNGFTNEWSIVDLLGHAITGAKSLFQKILAVSPCGSRFWRDRAPYPLHKSFAINTLENGAKKK